MAAKRCAVSQNEQNIQGLHPFLPEAVSCPPHTDLGGGMEKLWTEGCSPGLWVFYDEGNATINDIALMHFQVHKKCRHIYFKVRWRMMYHESLLYHQGNRYILRFLQGLQGLYKYVMRGRITVVQIRMYPEWMHVWKQRNTAHHFRKSCVITDKEGKKAIK